MAGDVLVVLAAGRSSRMGAPKGLLDFHGRPWIAAQIGRWRGPAVVVAGHEAEAYRAALCDADATVTVNAEPDRGQFSSIQVGLAACPAGARAWVLPVDVPLAGEATLHALEAALRADVAADAAVPCHEGHGGHPVALAPHFWPTLLARGADSRLDVILRGARTVCVNVGDPAVGRNVNTPEDWSALLSTSG